MANELRHTLGSATSPLNDVIGRMIAGGGWSVAAMREPGFRAMAEASSDPAFRALAPLPENSQKIIDTAVVEVGLERLTLVADLLAAGLRYNLTDPLSVTQLEWYAQNKVGAAQRTMSPSSRGENKLPDLLPNRLPVYLTTDEFQLDIRTLRMSQRVGIPLDTSLIKSCTRSVNEAIEDAGINGPTTIDGQALQVAGYAAYGLLTAPHAETQSLTSAAWSTAPVGSTVFAQVQLMIAKMVANKKFGPYRLYVGTTVSAALDSDYAAVANAPTIKERLLRIEALQAIRTVDLMPATKVVLVQMTSDVIDVVVGQAPTVIPWTSLDGFTIHNLVMAIMIPRVKYDYNSKSGICIGTLA